METTCTSVMYLKQCTYSHNIFREFEVKTSQDGINLIKFFEGLHDGDLSQIGLQPKMCPAGYWTEGYGHVIIYKGRMLEGIENKELAYKVSTIKTEEDAIKTLLQDLIRYEDSVKTYVKVVLTQNQFDALVSFTYNVGKGNFRSSTLLKKLNELVIPNDKLLNSIATEFLKWNKAKGKVLKGLTLRRIAEKNLFLKKLDLQNMITEIDKLSIARTFDKIEKNV